MTDDYARPFALLGEHLHVIARIRELVGARDLSDDEALASYGAGYFDQPMPEDRDSEQFACWELGWLDSK